MKYSKNLIETYVLHENGFHPVLIDDNWQVGKLHYSDEYYIDQVNCFVKHLKSDRAISILAGNALLILSDNLMYTDVNIAEMKTWTSDKIPKNAWCTVAMNKEAQLFIVEMANAHIDDVREYLLSDEQLLSQSQKK